MGSLSKAYEQLCNRWQSLQRQWQASGTLWNDPVQRRFVRDFWQDFERVVPATMSEMQKLAEVIAQARRSVR